MLHAMAENIDDTALADLALKSGEEFLPSRAVVVEIERRDQRRLRRTDEGAQLHKIGCPNEVRNPVQITVTHVLTDAAAPFALSRSLSYSSM
jgi:hypothetical protein